LTFSLLPLPPLLLLLLQAPRAALLFDVMGLGKTIQALGSILATPRQPGEQMPQQLNVALSLSLPLSPLITNVHRHA
jgi:hypothetical protein